MPELVVPVTLDPDELKRIRRKERRQARKEAKKAGTYVPRQTRSSSIGLTPAKPTLEIPPMPRDEFIEKVVEILGIPEHDDPQSEWWLGFSVDLAQSLHKTPQATAKAIVDRAHACNVPTHFIAKFRGRIIGIGPITGTKDMPR